jgi:hypothetical protein
MVYIPGAIPRKVYLPSAFVSVSILTGPLAATFAPATYAWPWALETSDRSHRRSSREKRPSFWIAREEFVRQYQKIDGFWLPQRDETLVHVRLYGTKVFIADH